MLYIGYSSFGSAQDESSYSRPMKRRSLEAAARDAKQSKISGFFAAAKISQPSKPSDPKDEAAESSSTTVKSTVKSTALAQNASSAVALRNGVALPVLGFGTYRLGRQAQGIVAEALKAGYRLIDTGQVYDQGSIESAVGAALRHSGLPRSLVFISTKVRRSSHGFEKTYKLASNLWSASRWTTLTCTWFIGLGLNPATRRPGALRRVRRHGGPWRNLLEMETSKRSVFATIRFATWRTSWRAARFSPWSTRCDFKHVQTQKLNWEDND